MEPGSGANSKGDGPGRIKSCAVGAPTGTEFSMHETQHYDGDAGTPVCPGIVPNEGRAGAKFPCASLGSDAPDGATTTASPGIQPLSPSAGPEWPIAPVDYEGWISTLAKVDNLRQMGIMLAWGCRAGHSKVLAARAGPLQPPGRSRSAGELFPLPVCWPDDFSEVWQKNYATSCTEFSVECWVGCACTALNAYYGCGHAEPSRKPGKAHKRALEVLRDKVHRFLKGDTKTGINFKLAVEDLKQKRVSYTGEEVSQPFPLSAEQIQGSLPPEGHGGCIVATDFLVGRTKFLLENPRECLLPVREREPGSMQAKVHIKKGDELSVFKLLESRGVTTWLEANKVFTDDGGDCLNGLFGVVKPGKFTSSGAPILRVIMNLVPTNRLFEVIAGDVQLLPHGTAWIPMVMQVGEELRMSQCDMSAAFYLFAIPECWRPFMCFAYKVDGARIGRFAGVMYRPACKVLPMGWSSSVGIMQMISRQLLANRGLPGNLELHKAKALPMWFTKVMETTTTTTAWWQVYLDNFMAAERVTGDYKGADAGLQAQALGAWHSAGVLTADDKQVLASKEAVELGIRLDGVHGLLGGSPERVLKTCYVTLHLLQRGAPCKRDIQVVLGRWIFLLQFRRAAMGILSRSWEAAEAAWPTPRQKAVLFKELEMLLSMAPLIQTDLRCEYDASVTCSDASEKGGAAALSTGLTWSGCSLVRALRSPEAHAIPCPILVISAFNGVGGAFRVYDVLGVKVLGKIAIEIAKDANRSTRCAWPDVEEYLDINDISESTVRRWANLHPRALEVHVWGGFPCVHLSRVRAFRRNLECEGSNLFWKLLDLIGWVQQAFSGFARVKFCVENVASMDEAARREISSHLEVQPVKLDPADTLPYNRPRLAWCSEELVAMEELALWTEGDYVRAYVTQGQVTDDQWMRPGWSWLLPHDGERKLPTFMKSIARRVPPPFPAGLSKTTQEERLRWQEAQFRMPPYQYQDKYMLAQPGKEPRPVDSSEREVLLGLGAGHTATCRSASEAKANWTGYEDSRLSLCGDSFAIPSFAIIGAAMCASFLPRMRPSMIIARLGLAPGASAHPSIQVPMTRWLAYGSKEQGPPPEEAQLVRYLGLQVNHTGADVRIVTGEPMGKTGSHGSVRALWWQWKHLFKVRWVDPAHINFLEMKMILLTLLWKARNPLNHNKRWLHLEDSMVCLYILSKGRTSSHLLQPLANKVGALQMAIGCTVLHGHVGSLENPTDAASRQ